MEDLKLTQYSHGAGCGCKISPSILKQILHTNYTQPFEKLIVGNNTNDDAAVYDLDGESALISTTDFFTPIVDDPYEFGRIASANAISDVFAMGGRPIMAIAILGWPINKIAPEVAAKVIEGSRSICAECNIPLAGGHSIDSLEPIFGLSVNGIVSKEHIKRNNTAQVGDVLYLTKPLGVGILTTAEKKSILRPDHVGIAAKQMVMLNKMGFHFGSMKGVNAMTDVTGFGLLGHLCEMSEGSGTTASIHFDLVPQICDALPYYVNQESVPGGTHRNWTSYGEKIKFSNEVHVSLMKAILADPQTSGGLLVSVDSRYAQDFENSANDLCDIKSLWRIGQMIEKKSYVVMVDG